MFLKSIIFVHESERVKTLHSTEILNTTNLENSGCARGVVVIAVGNEHFVEVPVV